MRILRATPVWARALVAVVLLLALAGAAVVGVRSAVNPTHAPSPAKKPGQFTVLAPTDGQLTVGTVAVRQLAGSCDSATVCRYASVGAADLPKVSVAAGTKAVRVGAKQSSSFSVSAFNTTNPAAPVSVGFARGMLLLDAVKPGTYQVSVQGDRGGVWQFQLVMAKPGK